MSSFDLEYTLLAIQAGNDAGETPIESVPADGNEPASLPPVLQNMVLVVCLPVIMLVVGFIMYRSNRGATPSGARGGLVLMGIGAVLGLLMLVFLMLAA